jgi:hypothetical protein
MAAITLNQIAYDILGLNRAEVKDSDSLEIREVKFWINTLRNKLLKQRFDKSGSGLIDDHYVQSLGAVELEKIDSSIIIDLPSDRYYLRTKVDIPDTIERSEHVTTFTRIGPVDRLSERYHVVSHDRAIASGFGKFNNKFIYAFPLGAKLYLTSKDSALLGLKFIDIRGVFQNPVEAALFANPSYTDDDDYPINTHLIDDIKTILLSKELKAKYNELVDKTTDSEKNAEPEVKTK